MIDTEIFDENGIPFFAWNDAPNLRLARDILSDKSRWTTRAVARDSTGKECLSMDDSAVCWCSLGALNVAAVTSNYWLYRAMETLGLPGNISLYNDNPKTTHADVVKLFDTAMHLAEDAASARRDAAH